MSSNMFLGRFFESYQKFNFYENQVALIEGRNYLLIYAFYETLNYIRSNKQESDVLEKIKLLEEGIDNFILCLSNRYDFLLPYENGFSLTGNKKRDEVIEKFNKIADIFDEFVISYSELESYLRFKNSTKETLLIENLLIEFNNFATHFLNHLKDDNCSIGDSHLYRGCLDAYKEIILNNNIVLISKKELIQDFIKLRIKEVDNVGKAIYSANSILQEYKRIVSDILTILFYCKKDIN